MALKKIATLNKISPVGLNQFSNDYSFVDEISEACAIIVRSANMHDMEFSPELLAIARAGAGFNNIPIDECAEQGIVVFNTPGANANAVKELVIGSMIMTARNLLDAMEWEEELDQNVLTSVEKGKGQFAGTEIMGKTLGVIGLGAIGVLVANAAQALGMNVVGYDPYITLAHAHALSNTIPVIADLSEMMTLCDYVTIHVPVNDETKGMLDQRRIGQMKKGSVLMNFARNTLVDEEAVLMALSEGILSHYVTDFATDTLLGKEGVIAIPHLGASTKEAEDNCAIMAAEQIMNYIENGNIVNSVNYPVCDMGTLDEEAVCRVVILSKNDSAMLQQVTGSFGDRHMKIINMLNRTRNNYTVTLMDVDTLLGEEHIEQLKSYDNVIRVRIIER